MRFRDRLKKFRLRDDDVTTPMPLFHRTYDSTGVRFSTTETDLELLEQGRGERRVQEQYIILRMLLEEGVAYEVPGGFSIHAKDAVALQDDIPEILQLPERFPGTFAIQITGNTTSSRFNVDLRPEISGHSVRLSRRGAVLEIGPEEHYLLWPRALMAIEAVERFHAIPPDQRTEAQRVKLVAALQRSKLISSGDAPDDPPLDFSLGHLEREKFSTLEATRVGLLVKEHKDGSLGVTPDLGPGINHELASKRFHHLRSEGHGGVIRIENQFVVFDEDQRRGIEQILAKPTIPATQRELFYKAPGDFYSPEYVDVDTSFGVHVEGVGIIVPETFANAAEHGLSWFGDVTTVHPTEVLNQLIATLPELDNAEQAIAAAKEREQTTVAISDEVVDIADSAMVEETLANIRTDLLDKALIEAEEEFTAVDEALAELLGASEQVQVGLHIADSTDAHVDLSAELQNVTLKQPVDYGSLRRAPLPHQRDGINWLMRLMTASLDGSANSDRVQGGLLADDMGLGKTYMALVAIAEFNKLLRKRNDLRPTLAVMPVALLENWKDEVAHTFARNPFSEIVVLHGSQDLDRFRIDGGRKETIARSTQLTDEGRLRDEEIRFSLKVGEAHGDSRLDQPGRLILTNYETLSSYQLSLSQVDWGCVIFDEAQTIKNPDTLVTRAAKGLKAHFKLLATGTPIENSMLDFWCLMDAAQPGLLGSWADFRKQWVTPMQLAETTTDRVAIGEELRSLVGEFMLRRVKEDHLKELPPKTIYGPEGGPEQTKDESLGVVMPPEQQSAYDGVLRDYQTQKLSGNAALKAIQNLRSVSLHPYAQRKEDIRSLDTSSGFDLSARMIAMTKVLDRVRDADEKAIVFISDRTVQRQLSLWLSERYSISVDVVNGETKAIQTSRSPSRKQIIENFEARSGFGVIIMSPLAVGVGITVVGANHAIHLERHWNPAKEAQATDRIYRIGQTRPVHVYLPMALHPHETSFDINLDRLLQQKTDLRDSIVVPESSSEGELHRVMSSESGEAPAPISTPAAPRASLAESPEPPPEPESAATPPAAISAKATAVISSPVFSRMRELNSKISISSEQIARALDRLLDAPGNKITASDLSTALGIPARRSRGAIAPLRSLLNVEGYEVISVVDSMITLDIDLLHEQFGIDQ